MVKVIAYAGLLFKAWKGLKVGEMNTEYIVTGLIALLLLAYLMYALLKPERF